MAFGFMHGGVNNQPNADAGPSRVIRALAPGIWLQGMAG